MSALGQATSLPVPTTVLRLLSKQVGAHAKFGGDKTGKAFLGSFKAIAKP